MAESEVEIILREIRERVLAQRQAGDNIGASDIRISSGHEGNGSSSYGSSSEMVHQGDSEKLAAENSALIGSYLTTTARSWDRLPPVVSNRSGLAASIELWVKRKMKRATRWYIWEQVNFNAAAHHALRDMLQLLVTYERELGNLRTKIHAEKDLRHAEFAKYEAEMAASLDTLRLELRELDPQLGELRQKLLELDHKLPVLRQELVEVRQELVEVRQELGELRQELPDLRAEIGGTRVELETERAQAEVERAQALARQTFAQTRTDELNVQLAQLSSRLADLATELRESDERLQAEQQVSFRQLSLEIRETAVMEDRARLRAQSLLEELTLRIKRLEND